MEITSEQKQLQKEFLSVQQYYVGKPITRLISEEITEKYNDLFNKYGISEIRFRISLGVDTLIFTPIRKIDELAILGILS